MRIAGKVSCTSAIRMIAESVQPARVSGDEPEGDADRGAERHAAKADRERNAQPIEDRRQHVASLVVRPQKESRVSAGEEARRVERVRRGNWSRD